MNEAAPSRALQLALPLEWGPDERGESFLVGSSNARVVERLERWRDWAVPVGLLTGPAGSGRSLLARIFALRQDADVIDDAEGQAEVAVFHAWNRARESERPLLIVASARPPEWAVTLPDLRSRLGASEALEIGPPDDALARSLVARAFERRALAAEPALVEWLVARAERSHAGLMGAVAALDRASMERRRRPSIALAREVLTGNETP
jgi:chromosomal replication initiation ATPase DnaA